jgi:hypothetical protein
MVHEWIERTLPVRRCDCADDILKLATFQTGNGEQTVGIVRGDTVWYISTTMMANF